MKNTIGRCALLVCASVIGISGAHAAAWAQAPAYIDVAAKPMSAALSEIAARTGANILFTPDVVRGLRSAPVKGQYSAEAAARAAVRGTPLEVVRDSSGAMIIRRKVLGTAPSRPSAVRTPVASVSVPTARMAPAAQESAQGGGVSRTEAASEESAQDNREIVVTGTLLRGVAPAGTNVVSVRQDEVQSRGISSSAQILEGLPQSASFNNLQFPIVAGPLVTTNRPNLRSLPNSALTGGATTLVLLNGHRVVGMGIRSTTPDPDVVPPDAIGRVEVVMDGGSAIYGSDAVGGVMNFVTHKRYDGVQLNARYGFADDYYVYDINATAGKDWGSGSAFISYNFSKNDAIFGRDRSYVNFQPTDTGAPFPITSLSCAPGNVQVGTNGTIYALPFTTSPAPSTAVPNTSNQCDPADDTQIYPAQHRHGVLAGLTQQLSDSLRFDVTAYFFDREQRGISGPYRGSSFVGDPAGGGTFSPYYANRNVGPTETVYYAYGPADAMSQVSSIKSWGITPEFTFDLGHSWQLRATGNYGWSSSNVVGSIDNADARNNAIAAGLFNPFDPRDPATNSAAALAAIGNFETYGRARQELINGRLVLDGNLLTLPGGPVKIAAGFEYIGERLITQSGNAVPGFENTGFAGLSLLSTTGISTVIIKPVAALPTYHLSRNTKAVFGEVQLPLFGPDSARPGFEELSISASGRYDSYSDFGGTFNPKFGATYKPVPWLTFRGSWGRSFNAPSLADTAQADPLIYSFSSLGTNVLLRPPADLVQPNGPYPVPRTSIFNSQQIVRLTGTAPDVQPQKATTLSLGADLEVPFAPGLRLSGTYYRISFKNLITVPAPLSTFLGSFYRNYPSLITFSPDAATVANAIAGGTMSGTTLGCTAATCTYAILDLRKRNIGDYLTDGLDLSATYNHATGFGAIDFSVRGTYVLNRKSSAGSNTALTIDNLAGASRLNLVASAGANIGNLRAQVTLNHSGGYDLTQVVGSALAGTLQSHVDSFNVVNLFIKYDLKGENALKDVSFTLNVNNLLDADPPFLAANNGYANGGTLGRLIQLGVTKKF